MKSTEYILFILLIFMTICFSSGAANYYINAAGNDSLDGLSTVNAWKTLSKIDTATFAGNDVISLNKGDTWAEAFTFPSSGSDASSYITINAYGSGADPIINVPNTSTNGVYFNNKRYITIAGIDFTGGKSGARQVFLQDCDYINLNELTFSGNTPAYGLQIYGAYTSYITTDDLTFTTSGSSASIRISQTNGDSIDHLTFNNTTISGAAIGIHFYSEEAITDAGYMPEDVTIDGLTVSNTTSPGITIQTGRRFDIKHLAFTNIGDGSVEAVNAVQLNELLDSTIYDINVNGVDTLGVGDGCGVIVDYAYKDNEHISKNLTLDRIAVTGATSTAASSGISVFKGENISIHNCKAYANNWNLAIDTPQSKQVIVSNCTLSDPTTYNVRIGSASSYTGLHTLKNNIFYGGTHGIYVETNSTVPSEDYNDFYGASSRAFYDENTSSNVALGANSLTSDPDMNADYTLKTASPVINKGVNLSEYYTTDYDGYLRAGLWDIGAYEFHQGVSGITNVILHNVEIN